MIMLPGPQPYSFRLPDAYKVVGKASDFPAPQSGAVTLEPNTAYVIAGTVDLNGGRLIGSQNSTLFGMSPEYSILKSTGFDDSAGAFITTEYSLPVNFVGFHDFGAQQVLDIDGTGNNAAYDWSGVNFLNCSNIGTVANVDNFIGETLGLLSSGGLVFSGTIGTVAFSNSIFTRSTAGAIISVDDAATITRRFRIIYSAVVATSGVTALNISTSATIPTEGYILDTVNFSGGGTYLAGVQKTDEKALFNSCRGISNTATVGHLYMQNNATTTTATDAGTFYKVAGTTTAGPSSEKFTHSNNRLTYTGALAGYFQVTASVNVATSTNTDFSFRIAKNGTPSASGEMTVRQQSNSGFSAALVQDVFELVTGDYLEVFTAASQAAQSVLVPDMNLLIKRLTD